MDRKIFLQQFRNKSSNGTSSALNVNLKGRRKLLPLDDVGKVISQYDQYMEERENCNKIRLTCQVNPICSNVLFNRITEIVKDEGSNKVRIINYGLQENEDFKNVIYKSTKSEDWDKPKSIIDTQLSRKEVGFKYYCGLDIFNNHLIRSNTFKSVCKLSSNISSSTFNTIEDDMRDYAGSSVVENIYYPITEGSMASSNYTKKVKLHLYEYDDIFPFEEAVEKRLIKTFNGWVGFKNRSKIKTYYKETPMEIEKPLAYMNGGDFIDMYPGRDLYSFVPKYNEFQNRIEKNWNYCLTYPSSSYTPSSNTSDFSDIIECSNGLNSLKTIYFDENTRSDNGATQLVMYSIAKHGLTKGDYVNIYKTYKNGESEIINEKILDNAEVSEVVDEYVFTVFNSNVQISDTWVSDNNSGIEIGNVTYNKNSGSGNFYIKDKHKYYVINGYVNLDDTAQNISYKKVVNDIECDYYIRIFSKLPNFKFASGDTSNEYELYKNDSETIKEYQDNKYDFESHISKLAFARNIYSDEIGEVVFTDDIDLSSLKDNLGRPLSSLFMTIVKNNKGYKEWYGWNNENWSPSGINTNYEDIEYSHCFGPISCALRTSNECLYDSDIKNIVKINNCDSYGGYKISSINPNRSYPNSAFTLDDTEIWFESDKNFWGDLCCYDNFNATENHIQYVNHRFNTAQRESYSGKSEAYNYFSSFAYDNIKQDDFDTNKYALTSTTVSNCNQKKEGYYYIPHYEIPIKTFGKMKAAIPDFLTIKNFSHVNSANCEYKITTFEKHYLTKGDKAMIRDTKTDEYYDVSVISGNSDSNRTFFCVIYKENTSERVSFENVDLNERNRFTLFKMDNLDIPSYAKLLKDGTCRLIWRDVLNNGFNNEDNSVEEYPFTNGALYVNKKIDMYVRRQDPYGYYELYDESDIEGIEQDYTVEDNYVKEEDIEC